MVAPKKLNGKHRAAFKTQFDIANIKSGCMVTMHDDGCSLVDGTSNQQRACLLRKLQARDADGDPIFAFARPIPEFVLEWDATAQEKVSAVARSFGDHSMSRDPDIATIGDKYEANRKEKLEESTRAAHSRLDVANLPAAVAEQLAILVAAEAKSDSKKAVGSMRKRASKQAPDE